MNRNLDWLGKTLNYSHNVNNPLEHQPWFYFLCMYGVRLDEVIKPLFVKFTS